MAFSFYEVLSLGTFALKAYENRQSFDLSNQNVAIANQKRIADAQQRNETLRLNQQLIGQEKALEAKALGFDLRDIALETRRAKATALVKFGGQAGIDSQSYNLHNINIGRQGAQARIRRSLNYGTKVRRLDIELEGQRRATIAANRSASFALAPDTTGLALSQLGLGISAVKELGFVTDPKTGRQVPRGIS
jgi:hypothetical protein